MRRLSKERDTVSVVVGADVREVLDNMAQARTTKKKATYASDIVREAIKEYLHNKGVDMDVDVNRGGYRERAS